MDSNLVQHYRYKLQRRVRKLNAAKLETFHFSLHRFWDWLNEQELFLAILEQASSLHDNAEEDAKKIISGNPPQLLTESMEVAIAYWVIKSCVECQSYETEMHLTQMCRQNSREYKDACEYFNDIFVEPLYEFLDEQLDDQRAILALLRRYKQSSEWFNRKYLMAIYEEEKERAKTESKNSRAEKRLALNLYEYLHNQGLMFSIEPSSISGEADLVAAQESADPVIADVKIFDPDASKNKAYLISGFQQVYQYTLDYNEPFGYLVIFKTCESGLAISSSNQEQSTSFVTLNGKTIFFVIVDLYPHEKSASQRGKLKTYALTENELFAELLDEADDKSIPTGHEETIR